MKRLYLTPALLALGGFLLFGAGKANADACVLETGAGQVNGSNPAYVERYGAFIDVYAKTSGDSGIHCETYRTEIENYPTARLSGKSSESANTSSSDIITYNSGLANEYTLDIESRANASASFSNGSVTSSIRRYNSTAYVNSTAELVDLVMIENLGAASTDVNNIPVTYCSDLSSQFTTNGVDSTTLGYGDITYNGESAAGDSLTITGGNYIAHTTNGQVCRSGILKMTGKYVYFSLKLKAYTLGNYGVENVPTANGYTTNIPISEGSITASFKLGALPSGATCYSASGSFAGCERALPDAALGDAVASKEGEQAEQDGGFEVASLDENGEEGNNDCISCECQNGNANTFDGNPINFALGFKKQTELDYSGGLLSFIRVYRSDSTWTSGVMGARWYHNFDRVLNVITTPESNTVDITDASGAVTVFKEDTSAGTWEAVDADITTSFANTYDGSSVHDGYLYTTNGDTREYYDLAGLLQRIEYRGSQALDFAYDGSNRLSSVTNERGQSLTLSYNGSSKIASVVTPTGTYSYAYDGNGNLTSVTKPDTKTVTYHYENASFANALTGIPDEKGIRFATYVYDANGLAISSKHAGDVGEHLFSYNADGTTTVTNP